MKNFSTCANGRLKGVTAACGAFMMMAFYGCTTNSEPNPGPYLQNPDRTFLITASVGNLDAVSAGTTALSISSDSGVLSFAKLTTTDYGSAQTSLTQLARYYNVSVFQQPDSASASMIQGWDTLQGHGFDTVYLRAEITSHQNAVALCQAELGAGGDSSVRAYAGQWLPVIQAHLATADSLINAIEHP